MRKVYKLNNQIKFTLNELEISLNDESKKKLIDLCKDGKKGKSVHLKSLDQII